MRRGSEHFGVADHLRNSSKGRLPYYTEWDQRDLVNTVSAPAIRKSHPKKIFQVSSVRIALEAIEDDAVVFEKNSQKVFPKVAESSNDLDANEHYLPYPYGSEYEAIFKASEEDLIEEERKAHVLRRKRHEQFYADLQRKIEMQVEISKRAEQKRRARAADELRRFAQAADESARRIERESREQQDRIIRTRLQEQEERRLKLELLERQRKEQERKRFSDLLKYIEAIGTIHANVSTEIASFDHEQSLSGSKVPQLLEEQRRLFNQSRELLSVCAGANSATAEDLEQMLANLETVKYIQKAIAGEMINIQTRINNEKQKRLQKEAKLQEEKVKAEKEKKERRAAERSGSEFGCPPLPKELKFCVSPASHYLFVRLKEKLKEYESWSEELTKSSDRNIKKQTMELRKAISVPVSSVTPRSGTDLKNALRTLSGILKGRSVYVGSKSISTQFSPNANKFAVNFMAKRIVQQAANQVAANFDTAFCLAFLVIGLWVESEEFGDLFLGHLYSKCVYAIPFYVPKAQGQSDQDHQRTLGYDIGDDGTVEGQDKYLKRMSGLVRLYAAIIQSPLPPGVASHPHGLGEGWAWISRILNLEPNPGVSATVVYDFIIVAGHALMKTYRSQFEKLLYVLCHDYFPRLEEVTSQGQRAPLIRLKGFLEKCIKQKSVPVPESRLESGFWNTYHSGEVVGE